MYAQFTWDERKKAANPHKHRGITFELAQEVFEDEHHVVLENYHFASEGEQRMQAIGMSASLLLLVVIFVDRSADDEIVLHIISARKANAYERSTYRDQFL
jgi:uncharacterized protein